MMKPTWFSLITLTMLFVALAGCALFPSPPRTAHIQIIGPGNQTKEFVLSLDDLENKKATGFNLNDRYAIEIDLQWLWYQLEDINLGLTKDNAEDRDEPLTPWFICKYRF